MSARKEELVRPFLEARIAEDKALIADLKEVAWDAASMMRGHVRATLVQRVTLTEQILEAAGDLSFWLYDDDPDANVYGYVGLVLTRQWSEHPGFQPEWAADWTPPPVSVIAVDRPPRPDPAESDDRFTLTTTEANDRNRLALVEQREFNNRLRDGVLDTRALEALAVGVWPELATKATRMVDLESEGRAQGSPERTGGAS